MEMMKRNRHNYEILIEEGAKAKRFPEPVGIRVVSTAEIGVVGIAGPAIALNPLGMSVTTWQEQNAR